MSWDKRLVRRAFSAAAPGYDRHAVLQRQIGQRLLAACVEELPPGWWVDIGTGTGWCAQRLAAWRPPALLLVDLAEGMLHQARARLGPAGCYLTADAERLPLATGSAALVVSNLALQWCLDPARALAEMARILKPGGRLLLSTFTAGTLETLRRAWAAVDDYSHVNTFPDPADLEAAVAAAGFRRWRQRTETLSLVYPDLKALLRSLKEIGAHNVTSGRPRHLLGKGVWQRLEAAYPRRQGQVVATYVATYVTALR
ncbi:malonyl-CoA O-methyltransferase [Methylomarinovum tepidoasis]|uniref:Malonyl-[acyl-carrier protein] O-methyltransferase n=1 Tax=Methylomarinovum tepidoasis TaxID=2840183 RepID=A0AAU9CBM8_9GAMM|nr:malonyl-ACP O-methyltransferase BioC [Methylomarinovum sp. IN45]BCX89321.1 malonyl-CoA O-methyltransferase [Methylomarinovum sp. IN45]